MKKYGKNINRLYIIIFQSLTLKHWFYIIYDFLSVFSYSNSKFFNYIYTWFDWFIYINLLLAQIDMIIIEALSEIIITNIITYKYISDKTHYGILLN